MEKRPCIKSRLLKVLSIFIVSYSFMACSDDPDNYKSRNDYDLKLTASTNEIVLNESTPDEIALTLEWTAAKDKGSNFILTYLYEADLVGKKPEGGAVAIKEYEDGGVFKRSYTHKQLQEMLVNNWLQLTSTSATIVFTVTASYEGPNVVVPDISTTTIKIKTYGPKQFLANKLYMSGTAIGEDAEIPVNKTNSDLFIYNGELGVGTLNFPMIYGNEVKENIISPLIDQQKITDQAMDAVVEDKTAAKSWYISKAGKYRVTVNFAAKTVTIVPSGDILDIEKIYLAGSAIGDDLEISQTLEDENIFAFKGELKTGSLYLPILFEGEKTISIVPNATGSKDIDDGITVGFAQNETTNAQSTNYWNIKTAGTYRIVVNIDTKTITIYSSTTDLQNKKVSWNNTVDGINPYVSEVTTLWMYGGFNAFASDNNGFAGFNNKYTLTQSIANPNVFVYKGDNLPRESITDEYNKQTYVGAVRFTVSNIHNNVYAYGSTAEAKRNSKNGYTSTVLGASQKLVAGQGDNRYAFFLIPENTNYVMVDIENLVVVFGNR